MHSVDHDLPVGPVTRCQVCGSEHLRLAVDLGHQPLCDALLSEEQLKQPEVTYPLRLLQCAECSLGLLDYVVPRTSVYPSNYPYRAGISWPVVAAHKEMARELVERFGRGLCVDIGSNDGTLLAQFKALGCEVLGIEPTDIARIAVDAGVRTTQAFFCEFIAKQVACSYGTARIVTMTNVFAHMADLGEVMRGIVAMLSPVEGVLVIENHYLLDILDKLQFDSIYHEHVRTYTLKSLVRLFAQYGLEVFDVERVPRYGGNIRAFISWKGTRVISTNVVDLLALEANINYIEEWEKFRNDIRYQRYQFRKLVATQGPLVACSAPGRASTLLNYYGIRAGDIAFTGELDGSLKLGKYLPGCHIPVLSNKLLLRSGSPIILLAWHYADAIIERLKREGCRERMYVPLPFLREVSP